jgi:glycosyltransferase involved in cell wall biosynthesis
MKVSVVIATCFRSRMLYDMLDSLSASTNWIRGNVELETVFVIDEDDDTYHVAASYNHYDGHIIDFSPIKRGALAAWNRGLQLSTGDIIVPAGDDQLFHGNWLDYALESHKEKLDGYGVVGMNDLAYGENQVATMILFDRKYCKEVMGGVIAPPVYNYYCIDLEWNEKAKMTGHFYREMRAKVEHLHSAHNKRPVDVHDMDRQDNNYMALDNAVYRERKEKGFQIEWESLI